MSRRSKAFKSRPPARSSANHCRALVLVDGSRIRQKLKQDYEKTVRELALARQQLDQYHKTDLPQFTQWLNRHFGALLTELRELGRQLAVLEGLLFEVEEEAMFEDISYGKAYRNVMTARENPPEDSPSNQSDEQAFQDEGDPGDDARGSGNQRQGKGNTLEDLFEEFFKSLNSDEPPGKPGQRKGRGRETPEPENPAKSRLKELYRLLARRLHPDAQREMTPQKAEWWHQAQAAYEAGDVDQLEVILTLCEISDHGTTSFTSASLLQRIIRQLRRSLSLVKSQTREFRHNPAWNFSQVTDLNILAREVRESLQGELRQMRYRHKFYQDRVAEWQAEAERLSRKKGQRRPRRKKRNLDTPF